MNNELTTISNVRGFIDNNGTAQLNLEDVARGLGFTQVKGTKEYIRWETIGSYLVELGFSQEVGKDIPEFVPENIFYRLAFKAKNKTAESFQALVCDEILPAIRRTGHYETQEFKLLQQMSNKIDSQDQTINDLKKLIESNIFFQPIINPRHKFELLRARFFISYVFTGKDLSVPNKDRVMYNSIGDWLGVKIPYANEIPNNITVRDYLLHICTIEELDKFICGIEKKQIVKSKANHWIDLNGIFSNEIEWNKILAYFNHECAYCGSKGKLVPEHVIPQRLYSSTYPEKTDLIGNIVPSCTECNGQKKDIVTLEQWYNSSLPQFEPWRLQKIYSHLGKYEVI